jgi:hypothetical protein
MADKGALRRDRRSVIKMKTRVRTALVTEQLLPEADK